MSTSSRWIFIIIGLLAIVAIVLGTKYNSFVKQNEAVDAQWAQVQSQYQRRFDLIPNLVNSVKGIMTQEQKVFSDIADARTKYSGASTVDEKVKAAGQVESAIGRLLVITENYPELKSSDTVKSLMVQLEGTENRIAVARGDYNSVANSWNVTVARVPTVFIARLMGFDKAALFDAQPGTENAPKVEFNLQ